MVYKGVGVGITKERDDSYLFGYLVGIGSTWLIMTLGQGIQAVCLCFYRFLCFGKRQQLQQLRKIGAHSQERIRSHQPWARPPERCERFLGFEDQLSLVRGFQGPFTKPLHEMWQVRCHGQASQGELYLGVSIVTTASIINHHGQTWR